MNGNKLLVAALVIQAGVIIGLWYGPSAQSARAGIPDGGAQNVEMIQQMADTNAKLDQIIGILQGGQVKVSLVKPD
jgi:hypothetical protein